MYSLVLVVCITLIALALIQVIPGLFFAQVLWRSESQLLADEACPPAVVLLSLRGPDPFLSKCIEGLLTQDYPHYDVRIVVDHEEDPAWEVVRASIDRVQATNVHTEVLTNRIETCTGKSCGLLQAASNLDPQYEVVAILDADTVPHATWLRELVAPLMQEQIGVASGNRWFMPVQPTWGSLVRYAWNAAAVVVMYLSNFTWGGSVAIRRAVLRDSDLRNRWSHAVASDTAIYGAVRQLGLRAAFVPSLMIINRETCSLREFFVWVRRQLLVGKLQHEGWWFVITHGSFVALVLVVAIVGIVVSVLRGQWDAAALVLCSFLAYQLILAAELALLEAAVRKVVRRRGEATSWLSPASAVKLLLAIPLTQLLYSIALPTVGWMRDLRWRGVSYRVTGPWNVKLMEYEPYRSDDRSADSTTSL